MTSTVSKSVSLRFRFVLGFGFLSSGWVFLHSYIRRPPQFSHFWKSGWQKKHNLPFHSLSPHYFETFFSGSHTIRAFVCALQPSDKQVRQLGLSTDVKERGTRLTQVPAPLLWLTAARWQLLHKHTHLHKTWAERQKTAPHKQLQCNAHVGMPSGWQPYPWQGGWN